uniref:Protein kinase domain-containing protein n=1 Tax=Trypanosoma vivax (strain Y486) TaxID=1055687 RepID=G0TZK8_TRYVY|nr:putative protein kinase [Trypanosoma vivax Y486]
MRFACASSAPRGMASGHTNPSRAKSRESRGTAFTKPTAKFCSKCGAKKKTMMAPLPNQDALSAEAELRESPVGGSVPDARATTSTLRPTDSGLTTTTTTTTTTDSSTGGNSGLHPLANSTNASSRLPPIQSQTQGALNRRAAGGTAQSTTEEGTLRASPEDEQKYNEWATLGPEGITPEMLQTANVKELATWRRGSLIGRGTYGSVYLGLLDSGAFYAVKCVELGGKSGSFSVKELVSLSREINIMQRLQHKNLCTFKGVHYDAENASICMFMQYIGGGSLSSLVKKFKPLPALVVRSWTKQLLSGLLYLHSQRIIHRDVKGDNILVDTSSDADEEAQIKLVDFGAARRLSDAVAQSRTVIGTPYWMAPEVVDVTGECGGYSYKADVWSVGCTVAEMLTGRPPWPNQANAAAAIMMIAQSVEGPTELPVEEATPGCLDFMRRCFVRDPEQRPTVEELLQHPWIIGETE